MSIIDPEIDVLLDETDNDRFLLCALASKRAHDINDMMRGQRDRAIQLSSAVEIAKANLPLKRAFRLPGMPLCIPAQQETRESDSDAFSANHARALP